ncbi:hypothetical protein BJY24_002707 [Nocardia transvalensis]|uniref:DUF4326 domain-containing protein n=1 Tax=Nocardia transvalensis TaxID=37333 RepID=A0A7W9PDA2_9NOCA|nr:DUF4326 domain-containing protein [Nocardia transvalensis]MBB5913840.1 hypothetical protein [Nocardia transvalensis]
MPNRVQLTHDQNWNHDERTVVVAAPGRWANPFRAGAHPGATRETVTRQFREWLLHSDDHDAAAMRTALPELRGKDLACWCVPGDPCHGDVLLALANAEEVPGN